MSLSRLHSTLVLSLAFLAACSGTPAPVPAALAPAAPLVVPPVSTGLDYQIAPRDGGAALDVVATLPPGLPQAFHVDRGVLRWLQNAEAETVRGWSKLPFDGDSWNVAGCEGGCRVRYRFDMAGAARENEDAGYALSYSSAFVAPPSSWLFHPVDDISGVPYKFRVAAVPGMDFVTGVFAAAGDPAGTYGADVSDIPESPYSAFGSFETRRTGYEKGYLDTAIVDGPMTGGNAGLLRWIDESAKAISAYYGQFPIAHAALIVLVENGSGVGSGTTMGGGGGAIVLHVGRDTPETELLHEWQMTHEMIHLAFPNLERRYHWFEEGTATYIESVARARIGIYTPEEAWRGLARGVLNGQPLPGEGGLDDTPTWGRTYWGGALFCLVADVRIHEQTGNKKSLEDAFRAIIAQGGNIGARWDIGRVLEVGDKATGTTVLRDLHAEMGLKNTPVDLPALWARLGIQRARGTLTFDDTAPLAAVRKAIIGPAR